MGAPLEDIFRDFQFMPIEQEIKYVLIEGNGPFHHVDYMDFLEDRGLDPALLKGEDKYAHQIFSQHLVVGRKYWDKERILSLIANRAGRILKVYSQEMFLSFFATGRDPFSTSRFELNKFADGHPVLQFLNNLEYFDWPSTEVLVASNTSLKPV